MDNENILVADAVEKQTPELIEFTSIVDKIFDTTDEDISETTDAICDYIEKNKCRDIVAYFYKLVVYCMDIRPLKRAVFGKILVSLYTKYGRPEIFNSIVGSRQSMIFLAINNIIDKKKLAINELPELESCFDIYEKGSIGYLIAHDDIEGFQELTSKVLDFNFSQKFKIEPGTPPFAFLQAGYCKPEVEIICLAEFYGAIKIFKYLLLNNAKIKTEDTPFVIAGGDLEIIHLFEQKNVKFEFVCFKLASQYHFNAVFDWLLRYIQTHMRIPEKPKSDTKYFPQESAAIAHFNPGTFFFLNENDLYPDEFAVYEAVSNSDITMFNYFAKLENKFPVFNEKVLSFACLNGSYDIIDLLLKRIPTITYKQVLINACKFNSFEIVEKLINHGAKVQPDDNISLDIAIRKQNIPIIKLLLANGAKVGSFERSSAKVTGNQEILELIK